jgi:hypothetical protein
MRKRATLKWTLDRAASLSLRVEQVTTGRKVGRTCRPDSAKLRKRARCARYVAVGTIKRAAAKGSGTLRLSGKVGSRLLRAGTYRLLAVATDAKGKSSAPKALRFKITRR